MIILVYNIPQNSILLIQALTLALRGLWPWFTAQKPLTHHFRGTKRTAAKLNIFVRPTGHPTLRFEVGVVLSTLTSTAIESFRSRNSEPQWESNEAVETGAPLEVAKGCERFFELGVFERQH